MPKPETSSAVGNLALFFTLLRVLSGEDPKRVAEQTAELATKAEKLRDQIKEYMGGKASA